MKRKVRARRQAKSKPRKKSKLRARSPAKPRASVSPAPRSKRQTSSGLGKLLARSFRGEKPTSASATDRSARSGTRSVPRAPKSLGWFGGSGRKGQARVRLSDSATPPAESLSTARANPPVSDEIAPALGLTPPAQAPLSGELVVSAKPPVTPPAERGAAALPSARPGEHPGFSDYGPPQALVTSELIQPDDKVRRSIEGFLLDQRSEHTRRAYGKDLKRFVKFLIHRRALVGADTIERLDRTIIIGYKDLLLSEGLEHTTIDRHLATLRSFFQWLVDDGLIAKNPAEAVRFMNPKRISRTQGFSDEEVKRVLEKPDLHTRVGSLHYAILMVLFFCGLRRSEVCSLRTSNLGVERDHRVIRLRGKGNAERVIVLVPPVWKAIRHYLLITRKSVAEDQYLFSPVRNNRTGETDKAIDSSMIFYIVRKYAKLAGVANRVSPHSCRATAISNARDHLVPDRAIQEFAGWASTDMITRYDKRRTSVENSAAHAIQYGAEDRAIPEVPWTAWRAAASTDAAPEAVAPSLPLRDSASDATPPAERVSLEQEILK